MRRFVAAAVTIALMTLPAYSQGMGGGKRHPEPEQHKTGDKKPKVDEKAYRSAVEKIPETKEKVDPWASVREKPPSR